MSSTGTLVFDIFRGGQKVRTVELNQDFIKIGKLPSSHLQLDDPNVSRIHAVIDRAKNGEVHISDLGSSSGTLVNGQRVSKCRLHDGDEILLGETRIILKMLEATTEAAWGAAPAGSVQVDMGFPAPVGDGQARAGARTGYDDQGNWHDGQGGWYDASGNYHDGQGGWYDPEGNYHDAEGGWYDAQGNYYREEPEVKDTEVLTESFAQNYDSSGHGLIEVAFLYRDHILAVNQYKRGETITIGDAPKNTLQMKDDAIPDASFPVIRALGGEPTLNFTDKMNGVFYIGDNKLTLQEAIKKGVAQQGGYGQGSYSLPLNAQTRVRLDIGDNSIVAHHIEPAKGLPVGIVAVAGAFDLVFGINVVASFLVHAVFMGVVFFVPPDADSFALDNFDVNNRFVTQLIKPEEPEEKEEEPDWLKGKKDSKDKGEEEEEGAKHKGDEGKSGDKKSDQKDRKFAIEGPADNKEVKVAKDREVAFNSGALKILSQGAPLTSSFGSGEQTLGMAAITSLGDGTGERAGTAFGVGAFGTVGTGRGGGGVSERGVGLGAGGIGTGGKGGGGGGGSDHGRNEGQLEEKASRVPSVVPGNPEITGALDKEIIQRVIRSHRQEIKYCYEQELIKNKNLAGKVIIQFTISSTGSVAAAVKKSSTLNNANVENCISTKIRRWVFPEPKGGGIVRVSYPFVFTSSGGE